MKDAVPFVKWAGGKRSLIPQIVPLLPSRCNTFYEPFVGGGAIFFYLSNQAFFKKAVLNDTNSYLMASYAGIKFNVDKVTRRLGKMPNDKDFFLQQRAARPRDGAPPSAVASWFIYLNRTCFNGLYRVNKKGEFNVPFGKYKNPKICDVDNLLACSAALRQVQLRNEDFAHVITDARKGDFVFCDPPYLPRVHKGEFTKYDSTDFGLAEHERLASAMRKLRAKDVRVMITNSGTEEVRVLYKGFKITESRGARVIGATGDRRGHVLDFIITG